MQSLRNDVLVALRSRGTLLGLLLAFCLLLTGAGPRDPHVLVVTATAYNSLPSQTDGNPTEAAWGDELEPGVRAIAVSRDLVKRGFTHGTHVWVEGAGRFVVLDVMGRRWTNKIDIYMGERVADARDWGRREVRIYRRTP